MAEERPDLLDLLRDPGAPWRPAMFWLLNGRLTPERMRDQIRQMHERGCGGFFLHPMGERFRLGDFIAGIDPPYLSDEYFGMIRLAVEAAAEHGLYAWLYDEGGWPSGTAQGRVVEGHPELRGRVLRIAGSGEPVAEVTVGDRTLIFTADEGYPVDTLNPAATARFIELTHERYAQTVGLHFGSTIPGMFTDEVAVRGEVGTDAIPWTPGMLEHCRERRGFDLTPLLPTLFSAEALGFDPAEHFDEATIAAARCEFNELWTDLFREAYFEPINRWCAAHDLIHTGHVGGEDRLPDHRRSFGHFFKTAGALHAPGVDAIWRQVFPGQEDFGFPRLAGSALARRAEDARGHRPWRNLALSESFAVYGYSLTPEQMRWVADYQFVQGVSYLAPMALCYETSGGRFIGTMSHLGKGNPLWDSFSSFADHCGTVSVAIRESDPVADVAVYYPIEAAWLGGESLAAATSSLRDVCVALNERQIGYDIIDAHALADARASTGVLETPGQLYGAVVVPRTPVMPVRALAALVEFRDSGGRVAFCGDVPAMSAELDARDAFDTARARLLEGAVEMDGAHARSEMGDDDPRGLGPSFSFLFDGGATAMFGPRSTTIFSYEEAAEGACLLVPEEEVGRLAELLLLVIGRYELQLDRPQTDLAMASRRAGDVAVHLLHNQGEREMSARLMLVNEDARVVEQWDTLTGEPTVIAVHREVNEPTYFEVDLAPGGSALLTTRPPRARGEEPAKRLSLAVIGREVRAQGIEIIREVVITTAGDLEVRAGAYVPEQIPADFPLRPLEQQGLAHFSGTARYTLDVYVPPGEVGERLFLDLGEVRCVARAWLNGEELGESAWPPHRVEITGIPEAGSNELIVEVTNTLANQAVRDDVVEMARERGWLNAYYQRTLPWMRADLRSGLIGPVEVLRGF